jgi:hypothetical protein
VNHGGSDFQEILNAFRPKTLRDLKRFVGEHEAEDLAQEVSINVNRAAKATFNPKPQSLQSPPASPDEPGGGPAPWCWPRALLKNILAGAWQ